MTRRGPHEGSIHPRKDGRWAASVHIGWIDGKRVRKHVLGRTRGEVAEKLEAMQRAKREGRAIPDQRAKTGPFLRQWLDEVAKPTIRYTTYKSYDEILRIHLVPGLGRIPLAKLAPVDVQSFLNRKLEAGLSARRVQYMHSVLRRALRTAERWDLVSRNVARLVDVPRVPRHEITPLTPEQAKQLIEAAAEDRYRGLWITALGTGLRQGELLGLRWEDVDLDAGRLRVRHTLANVDGNLTLLEPKTDRSRRFVVLPSVVIEALKAHRTRQKMDRLLAGSRWADTGHVFATMLGMPPRSRGPTRMPSTAPSCRMSASMTCVIRRPRSSWPRASGWRT